MEVDEQIRIFREFIEQNYYPQLLEAVRKGQKFIPLDFSELIKFNSEICEEILESPEELLKAAELAVKEFDLPKKVKKFTVRFRNLPLAQKVNISDIRSKHLNKFISIEGVVRQKSPVRPHVTAAKFECPSCGNLLTVLQLDQKYKEPTRCGCGRKGKFKEISKELVDGQGIVLEESPDDLDGSQPKRLNIFLKDDLVSPLSERKSSPGSKVILVGWVAEVPINLRQGGRSTKYELVLEANFIDPLQDDLSDIKISEKEEEEIKKISRSKSVLHDLAKNIAPSIYGHDKIKEALVLQLAGGCRKKRPDGIKTRGDMHILLIGDPGAGKSQLLSRITKVAPKARFTSGKGATAAGLTASVVKDEFLGGWCLEAGTLVLANRGFAVIDEMDKMTKEDRSALHEALEQQTVSISKANIQATLQCETTVLAAANPKFGRFDPYDLIANQINLPPTLINRFDLIFPIKDMPGREKDEKMASFILSLHKDPESAVFDIPTDLLRKFFAYVRQKANPQMSDEAIEELKEYYVKMRNSGASDEAGIKSIPITARQLEALVRLSEASAKIRLSKTVDKEDARKSIELIDYCLNQIAKDSETGKIDIDRLSSRITASQRGGISTVKEIISALEEQTQSKIIPVEQIVEAAQEKQISPEKTEEALEKLRRSGDIFEPKRGFIQKL
ncbi:minichromosome maintenance protein MCM [Candidatus Woesearchaeota archaeon]|jgi:replicative DNA helicase Mcm|nr:minichromosome maintenance protein MCM [Candidatus Woesearchaeota archaeon]MBT5740439.1 minichromosome maintenance protein MCM [Candidatus Woesearchaeota archaeon]